MTSPFLLASTPAAAIQALVMQRKPICGNTEQLSSRHCSWGQNALADDEVDRTDVLLYAVMNRGLRLATDLPRLTLGPRPAWVVLLNPAAELTLTWPHVQPLPLDAPLNLATGRGKTAAQRGLVPLFVGDSIGLCEHAEAPQAHPAQRSPQTAKPGKWVIETITYLGRQQPLRPAVRRAGGKDHPITCARAATATHSTRRTRFDPMRRFG